MIQLLFDISGGTRRSGGQSVLVTTRHRPERVSPANFERMAKRLPLDYKDDRLMKKEQLQSIARDLRETPPGNRM
jgi:hypothetical protein